MADSTHSLQKHFVCISSSAHMPDHWLCFKQNLPKINRSTAQFTTRSTFRVHVNVVPAPPDREEHGIGAYNFQIFQGLQLNVKLFLLMPLRVLSNWASSFAAVKRRVLLYGANLKCWARKIKDKSSPVTLLLGGFK